MAQIRQFIERIGIYIFFISLFLFTQFNWMKQRNRYSEAELRLSLAFLAGVVLSFVIIKLIKKFIKESGKKHETLLEDVSLALSPGIFFIFASINKGFLFGAILGIPIASYILVKPFTDLVNSITFIDKFKGVLIIQGGRAVIDMKGTYERANPQAIQSFLIDLIINFHECSELEIWEARLNFSNLKGEGENELKPIIESVARYFNIKIAY
ncbi:MAG: hypothetical protein A2Z35_00665 [Actinobacteria bacterium RBG_19FT_COMBO_36_27]|nr:MAG: hypothetical protein A2Z35_00665 [Actinobacteria bacterium RBG_19FT_COMBO_36_27]